MSESDLQQGDKQSPQVNEDKQMLVQSMAKLLEHVYRNKEHQEEIFYSFLEDDLHKLLSNMEDSNLKLRKVSARFLCELLHNSSQNQERFCDILNICMISGGVCINQIPSAFMQILGQNPSIMETIIKKSQYIQDNMKEQNNYGEIPLCWYITLQQLYMKDIQPQFFYKKHNQSIDDIINNFIDPETALFGISIYNQQQQIPQSSRNSLCLDSNRILEEYAINQITPLPESYSTKNMSNLNKSNESHLFKKTETHEKSPIKYSSPHIFKKQYDSNFIMQARNSLQSKDLQRIGYDSKKISMDEFGYDKDINCVSQSLNLNGENGFGQYQFRQSLSPNNNHHINFKNMSFVDSQSNNNLSLQFFKNNERNMIQKETEGLSSSRMNKVYDMFHSNSVNTSQPLPLRQVQLNFKLNENQNESQNTYRDQQQYASSQQNIEMNQFQKQQQMHRLSSQQNDDGQQDQIEYLQQSTLTYQELYSSSHNASVNYNNPLKTTDSLLQSKNHNNKNQTHTKNISQTNLVTKESSDSLSRGNSPIFKYSSNKINKYFLSPDQRTNTKTINYNLTKESFHNQNESKNLRSNTQNTQTGNQNHNSNNGKSLNNNQKHVQNKNSHHLSSYSNQNTNRQQTMMNNNINDNNSIISNNFSQATTNKQTSHLQPELHSSQISTNTEPFHYISSSQNAITIYHQNQSTNHYNNNNNSSINNNNVNNISNNNNLNINNNNNNNNNNNIINNSNQNNNNKIKQGDQQGRVSSSSSSFSSKQASLMSYKHLSNNPSNNSSALLKQFGQGYNNSIQASFLKDSRQEVSTNNEQANINTQSKNEYQILSDNEFRQHNPNLSQFRSSLDSQINLYQSHHHTTTHDHRLSLQKSPNQIKSRRNSNGQQSSQLELTNPELSKFKSEQNNQLETRIQQQKQQIYQQQQQIEQQQELIQQQQQYDIKQTKTDLTLGKTDLTSSQNRPNVQMSQSTRAANNSSTSSYQLNLQLGQKNSNNSGNNQKLILSSNNNNQASNNNNITNLTSNNNTNANIGEKKRNQNSGQIAMQIQNQIQSQDYLSLKKVTQSISSTSPKFNLIISPRNVTTQQQQQQQSLSVKENQVQNVQQQQQKNQTNLNANMSIFSSNNQNKQLNNNSNNTGGIQNNNNNMEILQSRKSHDIWMMNYMIQASKRKNSYDVSKTSAQPINNLAQHSKNIQKTNQNIHEKQQNKNIGTTAKYDLKIDSLQQKPDQTKKQSILSSQQSNEQKQTQIRAVSPTSQSSLAISQSFKYNQKSYTNKDDFKSQQQSIRKKMIM